jgi:hypothetical protein
MDVPRYLFFTPPSREMVQVPLFVLCVCFHLSSLLEKQKVDDERIF